MRGPHVRFCERRDGAIHRAYSTDQHARLARLVKQALRDRLLEDMRTDITRIVEELIAAFPSEGTLDFCAAFADPLPAHVVGPMFGVPYTSVKDFNDWIRIGGRKIDALQTGVGIAEVESANRKMHDYLRDLLAERRQAPGDDLFSELMLADIDGDVLTEDELVYLATELASAGVDTTRAQLPLILHALLTHPDEMQKLRTDPSLPCAPSTKGCDLRPCPGHCRTGQPATSLTRRSISKRAIWSTRSFPRPIATLLRSMLRRPSTSAGLVRATSHSAPACTAAPELNWREWKCP